MPPSAVGHWHFASSRFITSRFTLAGTLAFRFDCFSRRASSAARRTCSSVAPGLWWLSPAFALRSLARNSRETVMWRREAAAVMGSTVVLAGTAPFPGVFRCASSSG